MRPIGASPPRRTPRPFALGSPVEIARPPSIPPARGASALHPFNSSIRPSKMKSGISDSSTPPAPRSAPGPTRGGSTTQSAVRDVAAPPIDCYLGHPNGTRGSCLVHPDIQNCPANTLGFDDSPRTGRVSNAPISLATFNRTRSPEENAIAASLFCRCRSCPNPCPPRRTDIPRLVIINPCSHSCQLSSARHAGTPGAKSGGFGLAPRREWGSSHHITLFETTPDWHFLRRLTRIVAPTDAPSRISARSGHIHPSVSFTSS